MLEDAGRCGRKQINNRITCLGVARALRGCNLHSLPCTPCTYWVTCGSCRSRGCCQANLCSSVAVTLRTMHRLTHHRTWAEMMRKWLASAIHVTRIHTHSSCRSRIRLCFHACAALQSSGALVHETCPGGLWHPLRLHAVLCPSNYHHHATHVLHNKGNSSLRPNACLRNT